MEKIILSGSIIIENNKLLLIYKKKHNHYEFPGGKVEENETIEQTAIRETKEEINCDVEIIKYIGYNDFLIENNNFRSHKFLAKIKNNQKPKIMEEDKFKDILWLDIDEYKQNKTNKKYTFAPNVKEFLENFNPHQFQQFLV
jgi:ADP-ribose pyrophosphatase YjhB (NUDIX family)